MSGYNRDEETKALTGGDEPESFEDREKRERLQTIISRIIYVVVSIIVAAVIIAIIVILILTVNTNPTKKERYSFDHMFNASFAANSASVVWSQPETDDAPETYVTWKVTDKCTLVQVSAKDATEKILITAEDLEANKIPCGSEFAASSGDTHIAFKLDIVKLFRHSVIGRYIVFDTVARTTTLISPSAKFLGWCPKGKILAYVQDNNIYLKGFDGVVDQVTVTTDGDADTIFNGVTDWIYEEEVYAQTSDFEWSPDCKRLAWLKLNDTETKYYEYFDYEQSNSYPILKKIRIPTPGTPNPIPSVHVFDVQSGTTDTFDIGQDTDVYIYDIIWQNVNNVAVVRLNRDQNRKDILIGDVSAAAAGAITTKILQTQIAKAWIHYAYARSAFFLPIEDGKYFVDVVVNTDGYFALALFDSSKTTDDKFDKFLASGSYDILSLFRIFRKDTNQIYYAATLNSGVGSADRVVYAVNVLDATITDISTGLTTEKNDGTRGDRNVDIDLHPLGKIGVVYYNGPMTPRVVIRDLKSLQDYKVLEENAALPSVLGQLDMPKITLTQEFLAADGQTKLNAITYFPPGFNEGVQYPVLMYTYGGPGVSLVSSAWRSLYNTFNLYVASLGYIVVVADGRGTGNRGYDFLTQTYKNLGHAESEDQIAVALQLKGKAYVNPDAVSIWGWSYGGYNTLMSVTSPSNKGVFKLGMSVAPVTDWRYYDSAYTERFMSLPTPEKNLAGYINSSVLNRVAPENDLTNCNANLPIGNSNAKKNSAGKTNFLLVHGLSDDNVHPLNSFNLIERFQNCRVQFDVMVYTNKDHSIAGTQTRRHLYRMLSNKLQMTLQGAIADD